MLKFWFQDSTSHKTKTLDLTTELDILQLENKLAL